MGFDEGGIRMNYQFFGMAGVISGIFVVASIVFFVLYGVGYDRWWYYKTTNTMALIAGICILLVVAFWFVIGIIYALNAIWNWGLVR